MLSTKSSLTPSAGAPASDPPEKSRGCSSRQLVLMVGAALAIRLIAVLFLYPEQLSPQWEHFSFGWENGRVARSIVSGHGFSSPIVLLSGLMSIVVPFYPFLLAGVFKVFGIYTAQSAAAILSLNSLFSALTCVPVYWIARKTFGVLMAGWAGWAWTIFPYAIYCSTTQVWSDSLCALLLSLIFLVALRLRHSILLRDWFAFGVLGAFAALVNPVILSVLPFLICWIAWHLQQERAAWIRPFFTFAFSFIVLVFPWFVRNYLVFHRVVPFRSNFWLEVRIGNTGDTSDIDPEWAHPATPRGELAEFRRLGEFSYMEEKRRQVIDFIHTHPLMFVWLTLRKVIFVWTSFWSFSAAYLAQEPLMPTNIVFCVPLTLLMLIGLRAAWQRDRTAITPYVLTLLSFPVIYYI